MHKIPRRILIGLAVLLLLLSIAGLVVWELVSSTFEARYLAKTVQKMTWRLEAGPSERIHFPQNGPYDQRLGYSKLPAYTARLKSYGWGIKEQAKISIQMKRVGELGLYLPYREKDQGGITLLDGADQPLYQYQSPARIYAHYEEIPLVLVQSLLYIENRELMRNDFPTRNPAVEWDRLGQAVLEKIISLLDRNRNVPGGSTLPTQIEKYRHSPEGLTQGMGDKLRQMLTASLRAYQDGLDTRPARRRAVLAYLNTVPLAAAPRFGEVNGVGDGLWAWYGMDIAHTNHVLSKPWSSLASEEHKKEYATALKHVLSLIVAERRPSYYLATNRKALDAYTDDHLGILAAAGVIPVELRDAAKKVPLRRAALRMDPTSPHFVEHKAANALRIRTAGLLGESRLYDLDRLDLQVKTTLNQPAQKIVSHYLQSLATPEGVRSSGLYGKRLLRPDNDLTKVIYSFTLFEKTPAGMLMRVQADNLNQPFDINQQTRLDLGSTAKLRTLVSYLSIIAELHGEFSSLDKTALLKHAQPQRDVLAQWVASYLLTAQDKSLGAIMEAAMGREYSAAPEVFFTGGGEHRFINFDAEDNNRILSLWDATKNSVNLVYIRVMRDVVRHYVSRSPGAAARVLNEVNNPQRMAYLLRFVDKEGRVFLNRFYQRHKAQTPAQMTEDLYTRARINPRRFTSLYRYLNPQAGFTEYVQTLRAYIPATKSLDQGTLTSMFNAHAPGAYDLTDRGYVVQIHPLELWLVGYLRTHPKADLNEMVKASVQARTEVYNWLFKTSRKNAQDVRIQSLLEVEAFDVLVHDWKRLGYPFDNLTPSYATAIGSSGDRPAALAELMGILLNDGVRLPKVSLSELLFASHTPYETRFQPNAPVGERLLPVELTRTVRKALALVVKNGTAGRLQNLGLKDGAGNDVVIGGKTGTGDHRFERYGAGGQLLESRVVNRTATFVFYLGDHYFGTLTALVPGPQAGNYEYTSSLVAQILKNLLPQLKPTLFPATLVSTPAPAEPVAPLAPSLPEPVLPKTDALPTPPRSSSEEKAEGSSSQADPQSTKPESNGGFPDSLDPSGVAPPPTAPLPEPSSVPPATPAPAPLPDAGQTIL